MGLFLLCLDLISLCFLEQLVVGWWVEIMSILNISFLSGVVPPYSFLILIVLCYLFVCVRPFLSSCVSCIKSSLSLLALVLHFSPTYRIQNTLISLLMFCLPFVSILSIFGQKFVSISSAFFTFVDFCVALLISVYSCFLYSCFFVFEGIKSGF